MKKNVFKLGLNEFNRQKLQSIRNADNYNFYSLIDADKAEDADFYDIPSLMKYLDNELANFDGSIDAIVSYIDFPISMMVPILAQKYGVPSASLESVMKGQHKYWSRVEQKKVIPENIPEFYKFDPFDDKALDHINLEFPFWIKPVKSVASFLGFRINDERDFKEHVQTIRQQIGRLSDPFNHLLDYVDLPQEIADVGGEFCLAEQIISGRQCTVEGYMFQGEFNVHGIVDSIRYPGMSTFFRYQYPSQLPKRVQNKMKEISEKVLRHIGYDNAPYNIEFFWDRRKDHLWLLEVNTRVSKSHSDIFEKVDGASNHQVTVEVGLGQDPQFPHRKGEFPMAAKFFFRKFDDAYVTRVPSQEEFEKIHQKHPGTIIIPIAKEGMWLSELNEQDSYSYEVAWIFVGGKNQKDLMNKYFDCVNLLDYKFEAKSPATMEHEELEEA